MQFVIAFSFPSHTSCRHTVMEYPLTRTLERRPCRRSAANCPERRYLTLMFCDLVNSTRLAISLELEDLLHLIQTYRRLCAEIIGNHDGFIANFTGDGVMIVFGYPRTRADDAERAVRAALDLLNVLKANKHGPGSATWNRISIRIGIASGLVLISDSGGTVVGEPPNLAARLQALAQPDAIVISNETRELVKTIFRLKNIGPCAIHGYEKMLRLWQVVSKTD